MTWSSFNWQHKTTRLAATIHGLSEINPSFHHQSRILAATCRKSAEMWWALHQSPLTFPLNKLVVGYGSRRRCQEAAAADGEDGRDIRWRHGRTLAHRHFGHMVGGWLSSWRLCQALPGSAPTTSIGLKHNRAPVSYLPHSNRAVQHTHNTRTQAWTALLVQVAAQVNTM